MATDKKGLIFVVGHEKGGVGKSMVSANVAFAFRSQGHDVVLVDTDTTGTSARWGLLRAQTPKEPAIPVMQATVNPIGTVKELVSKYDVIVVDIGAREYEKFADLALIADLWITPTKVGREELESTVRMHNTMIAYDVRHKHGKVPMVCVFNATPTSNKQEEATAREDLASVCPNLAIMSASLKDRKVYRDASRMGASIFEMPRRDAERAVEEFTAFLKESAGHVSVARAKEHA